MVEVSPIISFQSLVIRLSTRTATSTAKPDFPAAAPLKLSTASVSATSSSCKPLRVAPKSKPTLPEANEMLAGSMTVPILEIAWFALPDLSAQALTILEASLVMLAGSAAVNFWNNAACADESQPSIQKQRHAVHRVMVAQRFTDLCIISLQQVVEHPTN